MKDKLRDKYLEYCLKYLFFYEKFLVQVVKQKLMQYQNDAVFIFCLLTIF